MINAADMRRQHLTSAGGNVDPAYRIRGHLIANLDPLALEDKPLHPELDPKAMGLAMMIGTALFSLIMYLGLETPRSLKLLIDCEKPIAEPLVLNSCIFKTLHKKPGYRNALKQ